MKRYFVTGQNETASCYADLIVMCLEWDKTNEIISDSLRGRKCLTTGAYYKFVENPRKAMSYLLQALEHFEKVYPDDHPNIYKTTQSIAESYNLLGQYKKSNDFLKKTNKSLGQNCPLNRKGRLYRWIAKNYKDMHDYEMFDIYYDISKIYGDSVAPIISRAVMTDKASVLIEQHKYEEVFELLTGKKRPSASDIKGFESNYFLNNILMQAFEGSGNSELYFQTLLAEKEIISSQGLDSALVAHNYINLKPLYLSKNQHKEAIADIRKAINIFKNQSLLEGEFIGKIALMDIHIKLGENQKIEELEEDIERNFINKKANLRAISNPRLTLFYLLSLENKLDKFYKNQNPEILLQAAKTIRSANKILDNRIDNMIADNSIQINTSNFHYLIDCFLKVYKELYNVLPDENILLESIAVSERYRSLILLLNAQKNRSKVNVKDVENEKRIIENLDEKLTQLRSKNLNYFNKMKIAENIHHLADSLKFLRNTQNNLRLNLLESENLKHLKKQQILIFHSTLDSNIYRIYISPKGSEITSIQVTDELLENIRQVNSSILSNERDPSINLDIISSVLLPETLDSTLPIIIVPTSKTYAVPFDILKHNGKMLIHDFYVSYAFSINHLSSMLHSTSSITNNLTTFAPSYSDQQFYTNRSGNLGQLLYNIPEVENIKNYFPSATNHTGTAASLDNFISSAPNSNILHIAAHAKSDTTEAGCHIYFSDEGDDDYTLSLSDIYKMTIPAELVTLSACETATGEHLAGEGVLSLARGFAYAGAKSVVSSLWSANDESTSMIMTSFYKYLSEGKRKDEALRQAKLDFLTNTDSEYHHPYYWAAFIPVGDMSPIVKKRPYVLYGLAALIVGGFGIGLGYRKKLAEVI